MGDAIAVAAAQYANIFNARGHVRKQVGDIDAGAPTNGDGTINLVQYAAWLVKEMANRGD